MTEGAAFRQEVWYGYFESDLRARYYDKLLSLTKRWVQSFNMALMALSFTLTLLSLPVTLNSITQGDVSVAPFVLGAFSCVIFVLVLCVQVVDLPSRLSISIQASREWSSIRDAAERVWTGLEHGDKVDRKDWQLIQDRQRLVQNFIAESKLTVSRRLSGKAKEESLEYFDDLEQGRPEAAAKRFQRSL